MADRVRSIKQTNKAARKRGLAKLASPKPAELTRRDELGILQRAVADPRTVRPSDALALQHAVGNQAVTRLTQARLAISPALQFFLSDKPVQRQVATDEKELPREEEEMAAGIQTKRREPAAALPSETTETKVDELLTVEQVHETVKWHLKRPDQYPKQVVQVIQEKTGSKPDGIIGPTTIQAIASWQKSNELLADGKAGGNTLLAMFGRDIRADAENRLQTPRPREGKGHMMDDVHKLLGSLGLTDEQRAGVLQGKEPSPAPETTSKSIAAEPSKYKLITKKGFAETLDGVSLKASLLDKISRMADYALANDLIRDHIVLTSGMRSPKDAHRWSTAYQIRQGNVPLEKLQGLPAGNDLDGNTWYMPGWTKKEITQNAAHIWDGALAAEGFPKGDLRREPNTFPGGVTQHATGKAVDAVFVWKSSAGGEQDEYRTRFAKLRDSIQELYAERPKKLAQVLAAIDKFEARGSFGAIAEETVTKFGLKRPVLHSKSAPEDWHYEER